MSTQEEITIARAVLAGWTFMRVGSEYVSYDVISPSGNVITSRSTRYTAALAALQFMEEGVGLPDQSV